MDSMTMVPGAEQLRDIRGLDPISWWPLAPGWWLTFILALILAALIAWMIERRSPNRWRWEARAQLRSFRRRLRREDPRIILEGFSELMRRLAMARHGRDQCAGLVGEAWLQWLAEHDPQRFDWMRRAAWLEALPYAPPGDGPKPGELSVVLDAAVAWTHPVRKAPKMWPAKWMRFVRTGSGAEQEATAAHV
jgi:hypothetical protein